MYVHQTNRGIANRLTALLDEKGRIALDERQCKILEIIGRFDREDGNFMSPKSMLEQFPGRKPTLRTLRRHLRYFEDQGMVFSSMREDGRLVRRLAIPSSAIVESLAAYRERVGMTEYAYRQRNANMTNENLSFLPAKNDKFCPEQKANFAPPNKDEYLINDSKRLHHPPLSPLAAPVESQHGGPSAPDAGATRPHERGSRRDPKGGIHTPTPGNISEPIPKGRARKRQTLGERAAEAASLIAKGHVVNPLGRPNVEGRKLKPSLAAVITPNSESAVTIPQLFRAYVEIYDGAFGIPGLLEQQIPPTREFMEQFVGHLRQVFYDVCGYSPTNRDIWEYIKWFHEPEMLTSLKKFSNRIPDHPGIPHPNQLRGKVYVKAFYDRYLANKNPRPAELMSRGEIMAREAHKLVQEAYEELRTAGDRDFDLVLCLVTYGYVIFSEYLRDTRDLSASDAKQYIINLMARYIRKASDKAAAEKYLDGTYSTTERLPIQDSSLWQDWRAELKDAVKIAVEISRQANPQGIQS